MDVPAIVPMDGGSLPLCPITDDLYWPRDLDSMSLLELADLPLGPEPKFLDHDTLHSAGRRKDPADDGHPG